MQTTLEKITGARLPITNALGRAVPVQIYVGRSTHTDQLKISDNAMKFGELTVK